MRLFSLIVFFLACCNAFSSPLVGGPYYLDPKNVSHYRTVVSNFNTSARNYANMFGGDPPIGENTGGIWTIYRGAPTQANAIMVQIPVGGNGFAWEIIQPADQYPSFWRELLRENGNFFHHFGIQVPEMDQALSFLASLGYEMVQMGQGGWGCYAYVDARRQLGAVLELLSFGQLNCTKPVV